MHKIKSIRFFAKITQIFIENATRLIWRLEKSEIEPPRKNMECFVDVIMKLISKALGRPIRIIL